MRDFLDAILAFIGAESLTDAEYDGYDWGVTEEYSQSIYDGLEAIIEARDNVSNQPHRLKAYFEANGAEISDVVPTPTSNIYLGGDLSTDTTNAEVLSQVNQVQNVSAVSNVYIGGDLSQPALIEVPVNENEEGDINDITVDAPLSGGGNLQDGDVNIGILQASATEDGYLSKEDWAYFNGKPDTADVTQAEFDALQAELDASQVDITNLQSDVSQLQSDVDAVESSVSDLDDRVTEAEGDIDALETSVATLVPQSRTISTTSPLAGGGDLSANRTLSIADAAADGSTKGAASFNANDFNASSGNISIDYTNGTAASAGSKGFLTSTDWSTFNNKVSGTRAINTTSPLSGGGDLSADRTLSIADAAADGSTKGAAAFNSSDFNSSSGVISIDYANGQAATAGQDGFLQSADFTTFNGKIGGDVGATDGRIPRADGTGGKTIQASGVTIDDSDNVDMPANATVAVDFEVTGVTANINLATGGSGSYVNTGGSWYLLGDAPHSARVYSYKVVNGHRTYSNTYLQLPTVTIDMADDDMFGGKFTWSWSAAASVDGYRVFRWDDGSFNYDKYIDTTGTSINDTSQSIWTSGTYVSPSFSYTNDITLNGIIQDIVSSITFYGNQTFNGSINVANGDGVKLEGTKFLNAAGGNTGVGAGTLSALTSGNTNTCVGNAAGDAITSGTNNTFIGDNAGGSASLTTLSHNTFVGSSAGGGATSAQNTIIGSSALGFGAGNNIIIGYQGGMTAGISQSVVIGNTTTCDTSNVIIFGSSTVPYEHMYLGRGKQGSVHTFTINATGTISGTSNATASTLALAAGRGTGNSTPATILLQTGDVAASGTTIQTLATKVTVATDTVTFAVPITLSTKNIITDTSTGTKIGTGTTQKLGFWNATPIAQPTTAIAASTFTANTSGIANDTATWDGYTIGQVVKALRNMGALA